MAAFSDPAGEDLGTVTDIPFGNVGTSTIYIAVPKNATVYSTSMNVSGYVGYSYYQSSFKTRFYAPSSGVEYYESRVTVVGNTLYNPASVSIDTGSDGVTDWSMTGELNSANSPQTVDLNITAIQAYLNNCTTDICNVPLDISSDTAGIVQLDALSVKYYSSATLASLSSGDHSVTVYASDEAGNMNSSTVYFTVMRMDG